MTTVRDKIIECIGEIDTVLVRMERNLDRCLVIANRMEWELVTFLDAGHLKRIND